MCNNIFWPTGMCCKCVNKYLEIKHKTQYRTIQRIKITLVMVENTKQKTKNKKNKKDL